MRFQRDAEAGVGHAERLEDPLLQEASRTAGPAARSISTPSTSEPVLYIQRSPGWYISGRRPRRRIHSSGAGGVCGLGMPWPSSSSVSASAIGTVPGAAAHDAEAHGEGEQVADGDRPVRGHGVVERRRRAAAAPAGRPARAAAGSPARRAASAHSSTRIMAAAAVIGLVIDEMRKIVSRRIGCCRARGHRADRVDVALAPARDERHEAGHLAPFDVAGHHVVQPLEPLRLDSPPSRMFVPSAACPA